MRLIFISILLILAYKNTMAQTSYDEQRSRLLMVLNQTFAVQPNSIMVVASKADMGFFTEITTKSSFTKKFIINAFEFVNCEECQLSDSIRTKKPLSYIYEDLNIGEVFIIQKEDELYKIKKYKN